MNRTSIISVALVAIMALGLSGCGFLGGSASREPSYKASQAVKAAYSQMGKPYRVGGSSPKQGFDCSGLIYWAYRSNGIKVPRVTKDQAQAGTRVSRDNVAPGDIIVFRIKGSSLHTGMYAGGNTFIHSPSKGKTIRMDNLSTPYWSDKLISVRRIL